ncbi:Glycosyltransferase, catalytic subunit of cellulose synthase and poly-beta-1,6-N-acetylglucosamine synthase [Clostridium cavendishii DSM 21758]|uniref:Glycosyltransferase, catalytic subunit of cellulose synthase and poly-beta-1,6-N-acetylglucosamine synthase n=1 Tax=Clostridium cavendishii DSM 21758 TaxID=1121302 RepID=A0A1M6B7L4_9CLOT|nr:glycosyltransferase family 2 protein [Clostridium cavendishii]SHI44739.1 Glycosyltransferase, catalytic subunit of cellulose synthase and poly-beta-1,6-N-acetylglucosamine synthase [Clostridium cavendishii DSM 21758]
MKIFGYVIYDITFVFQILVLLLSMYYFILGICGIYRKKDKKVFDPKKSFAMIVAAHNEEVVIANMVDSLNKLDYPKEMYDIFVIADNCNDNTAKIAREHGAEVFERFNKEKRGKGYALEWMFDKIFKMEKKYDAVCIFDADNLVSQNFLKEMNNKMCEGFKVVQGYLDSKNPDDSWIAASYSIGFWSVDRFFQLSRANLGLTNQIGGTGFAVDTRILKELGWGATCLTEDLEFSCKLVLNGEKVGWAHDAIIYDEKPLTFKASWNQRKRWMSGFADVASRFFTKLMKKAIKERSFVTLDCALYLIQPFAALVIATGLLILPAIKQVVSWVNYLIDPNVAYDAHIVTIMDLVGKINTAFGSQSQSNNGMTTIMGLVMIFGSIQFMVTPLILLLDKKISKKMFAILGVYSLNFIATSKICESLTTIWKDNTFVKSYLIEDVHRKVNVDGVLKSVTNTEVQIWVSWTLLVIVAVLFIGGIYLFIGKKEARFFYRIAYLYLIFSISWLPITIQGIKEKDNKEWSHTKHVRQIGIYDV